MDAQVFIDAARYAHILAVAIGFGAAFLADYHVISRLGRPIDDTLTTTLNLCHSVIWKMVIAMWVTGLILIGIRTGFVLANFTPKLICKVITVAILTGNAMLISKIAVPLVEQNRGRSLMWLPLSSKLCLAGIGAISSASWMLALAMGSSKVLAASGWVVFAVLMPFIYFLGVFAAVAVMFLLHMGGQLMAQPIVRTIALSPAARRGPVSLPANPITAPQPPAERHAPVNAAADLGLTNRKPETRRSGESVPAERLPTSGGSSANNTPVRMAAEQKVSNAVSPDYLRDASFAAE